MEDYEMKYYKKMNKIKQFKPQKLFDVLDTNSLNTKQIKTALEILAGEDYKIICGTNRFIILEKDIPKYQGEKK